MLRSLANFITFICIYVEVVELQLADFSNLVVNLHIYHVKTRGPRIDLPCNQ